MTRPRIQAYIRCRQMTRAPNFEIRPAKLVDAPPHRHLQRAATRNSPRMPPSICAVCKTNRALILRPKDHSKLCKPCFINVFETEIHHTILSTNLFQRGERIAIGASGGKDSTVLASVLKTLNERYDYGLDLILLSIDEGIKGYRDDSLETVKRNAEQYGMELTILGYDELYGWTMDQVVEQGGERVGEWTKGGWGGGRGEERRMRAVGGGGGGGGEGGGGGGVGRKGGGREMEGCGCGLEVFENIGFHLGEDDYFNRM